jgi:thiamine-phosphate diphosphorylase / hydroxyethylthiazole kinase
VTVSSVEEALTAAAGGADYLGIGTVYATSTKKDTKSIIGTQGVQKILESLASAGFRDIQTVCIGGIKVENVEKVLRETASPAKQLNGVAVVSAVMAAEAPDVAAETLALKVRHGRAAGSLGHRPSSSTVGSRDGQMLPPGLRDAVPAMFRAIQEKTPLSHNMTNLVVQNFAANVALAVGASPIMANYGEEAEDLSRLGGALVINMGTVTPEGLENYSKALRAYNRAGRPVLFDPVG